MAGREQQVQQMIQAQGIRVSNLRVEDRDAVISIYGDVDSADAKQRLEKVVEDTLKVKVANHVKAPAGAAGAGGTLGQVGSVGHEGQKYTVKSGDSLSKIAKHFYGDAGKWKKIHEANKAKIPNPDLIHPGDELVIPSGD
jgi:nucleoid-associated protein YgaU